MSEEKVESKWEQVSKPPKHALKQISGGRLKGMTDINPQWRYQVMTEAYGPCGVGWKYSIDKTWTEEYKQEVLVYAQVSLYIATTDPLTGWSEPIPGIGGSRVVTSEKNGLYVSDEGYKMAVTDALSVAMKMLGVASDIYMGLWDGSKYHDYKGKQTQEPKGKRTPVGTPAPKQDTESRTDSLAQIAFIKQVCYEIGMGDNAMAFEVLKLMSAYTGKKDGEEHCLHNWAELEKASEKYVRVVYGKAKAENVDLAAPCVDDNLPF